MVIKLAELRTSTPGVPANSSRADYQLFDTVGQCIYIGLLMTARRRYSFWIDEEQAKGLKAVKERDGVLESEQIRRAINDWLEKKGVRNPERKRAGARKRS